MVYKLRAYQQEAVTVAINNIDYNGIIVLPTAAGKSLVIAGIIKKLQTRTIILQPTKEILEQNLSKMKAFEIHNIGVFSASMNRKDIGFITFATIGTIIKHKEAFKNFDLIIVDECQGVSSKGGMYENFITTLGLPVIGLTATPYRMRSYMNTKTLEKITECRILTRTRPRIFNKISYVLQPIELLNKGYLSSIKYYKDDDYNIKKVMLNSTGMGYDKLSLKRYHSKHNIIQRITKAVMEGKAHKTLIFTEFKSESAAVIQSLKRYNVKCVEVSGSTKKKDREQIVNAFRYGDLNIIVNVGVFTIGADFPELDRIIFAKPTRSVGFYYQVIGRGVRIAHGKKHCELIDLCGNVERFGRFETFRLCEPTKPGLWRLRSECGFLTGIDLNSGKDLEKS